MFLNPHVPPLVLELASDCICSLSATIAADGLAYARTQRMVAVGTSVVNLFVKVLCVADVRC